jgi:aminopeptidase N
LTICSACPLIRCSYTAHFFEPRLESQAWELGLGQGWYPAPRAFRTAALFTYRAIVRAKKPLVPFTSGDTIRRGEEGAWNLVETRLTPAVSMVGVLAGPYSLVTESRQSVTVNVASYSLPKAKATARLLELFDAYRALYEPLLGPFPWKELTIAETSSMRMGQATPELILLTRGAFMARPRRSRGEAILPEGIDRHLAHELAHAWFGYGVWGATEKDQWLEEGLPELLSAYAIEKLGDPAEAGMVEATWRTRARDSTGEAPLFLASAMTDKATLKPSHEIGRDRVNLVYFKGATVLLALRRELGDERFFGALGAFLRERRSAPAVTTDDLVGFLSRSTGKDWAPWFARTVYGMQMP